MGENVWYWIDVCEVFRILIKLCVILNATENEEVPVISKSYFVIG